MKTSEIVGLLRAKSIKKKRKQKSNEQQLFVSCWIHTYFIRRELPIASTKPYLDVLQKDKRTQ